LLPFTKTKGGEVKIHEIILISILIGIPLGDYIDRKRQEWEQWKKENWG
jgi:hypothetical protein